VERHPHDARLLGQRLQDRLPDPPDRVGDELDPLGFVELVGGADETEVALVDQVGKRHALILVFLGDCDNEAEGAADQGVEGLVVTGSYPAGEGGFLRLGDEWLLAYLAEVEIERPLIGASSAATSSADLQRSHRRPRVRESGSVPEHLRGWYPCPRNTRKGQRDGVRMVP